MTERRRMAVSQAGRLGPWQMCVGDVFPKWAAGVLLTIPLPTCEEYVSIYMFADNET